MNPESQEVPANLKAHIHAIGRRLVACQHRCEGVAFDPRKGILPRFLILETDNRTESAGSVVIGINPGQSRSREGQFYVARGQTYENTVAYWERNIRNRKYYKWLRNLVDELGFSGPILWTELAKCEKVAGWTGLPPLQTFRTCVGTYLREELKAIPETWPLIAAGTETYKAAAYLFPTRAVLGVPHPTGSYGHFARLFDDSQHLLPEVQVQAQSTWQGEGKQAVWISADLDQ